MEKKIETLTKNILSKEFIKSFRPMYCFQMLIASSRLNIKDSFVTSPSLLQKCHTILSVIGIIALEIVTIQNNNLLHKIDSSTIYYLSSCVTVLQTLTFICNIFHVRFVNGSENAFYFVKLQQIDRCMKIDRNKVITDMMFRKNALSLICVLTPFCALFGVAYTKQNIALWSLLGIVYTQINVVVEMVACSNIFMFFYIRTRFLNSILYNYIHHKNDKYVISSKNNILSSLSPTKKFMNQLAAQTHNFATSKTDIYLKEILSGFAMNQAIIKFQIFLFCCKLVASCLLAFEFVLFAAQNDNLDLTDSLTPAIFTVIDVLVALILVIRCELFLREVKGTKRLTITIMSLQFEGQLREKAKRMLKLIEETPPRLSVYEMWKLDANVLLEMFMLVTTLILTQLQFVFL